MAIDLRRCVRRSSLVLSVVLVAGSASAATATVYVGTYAAADKPGIHQLELDLATGELREQAVTSGLASPSFLAFHPSRRFIYAVSEVSEYEGRKTGAVAAFAVDGKTGALTLLNRQASGGDGPCYITVAPSGRYAFVANYGGGTVSVLPIGDDGRLGAAVSVIQHRGSGPVKGRQDAPHAHSADLDPTGHVLLAADLGLDKVMAYRVRKNGTLIPNPTPFATLPPGSGPRHLAFGKSGAFVYVISELSSTVTAFAYDSAAATLKSIETVSTLPAGFSGTSYPAEIAVSRDGRFLYGSNRGHDSIASFAIDGATGQLRPLGHTPTGGNWPRHFAIDPTGAYLLAANQRANSVVVFRIDSRTGALQPAGHQITVAEPACVAFR